jgi:hypothetical protein
MNIASYGDTELKFEFHDTARGTAWLKITERNSEFVLYAGRYVTANQLQRVAEILNEPIMPPLRELLDDEIPF